MVKNRETGIYETTKHHLIVLINKQLKAKMITLSEATKLAEDVVDQIKPNKATLFHQPNLQVLEDYWEAEYVDRDIVDKISAKAKLRKGVEAVGHYSLLTASRQELQREVDSRYQGNKQRRVVESVNQLLRFLKRGFTLKKQREEARSVRFITEEELNKLLTAIPERLQIIYKVAFGTGLRLGEIFALEPDNLRVTNKGTAHLYIQFQIDKQGKKRETKTRKARRLFIVPSCLKDVEEWVKSSKEKLRHLKYAKITRAAAEKTLGRPIVFHDLRHSYAKHLDSNGSSLEQIKDCLGNSIITCEKYYTGFEATADEMDRIADKFTPP